MDGRKISSARNTPEPQHRGLPDGGSDTESMDSLKLGSMRGEFTGSTGSLPSIGTSSVSDYCPTPDPNGKNGSSKNGERSGRGEGNGSTKPTINIVVSRPEDSKMLEVESGTSQEVRVSTEGGSQGDAPIVKGDSVAEVLSHETVLAQEVVRSCLESAAAKLQLEVSRTSQQNEESVSDT